MVKHGLKRDNPRLYNIWKHMMSRCYSPKNKFYKWYGGMGKVVCDNWHDPREFAFWAANNGYNENLTIDRIDNKLGYYPENCRWATRLEQGQNQGIALGAEKVIEIRKRLINGERSKDLAEAYGVKKWAIMDIKLYKRYPNVAPELKNTLLKMKGKVYKLTLLIIFVLSGLVSNSQLTDTIVKVKASQVRKVYADALQKPILLERIAILNSRIADKDSVITLLQSASQKDEGAIVELQSQKKDLQEEIVVLKSAIDDLVKQNNRLTRQLKFQKVLAKGSILVVAGLLVKIFLVK